MKNMGLYKCTVNIENQKKHIKKKSRDINVGIEERTFWKQMDGSRSL